MSGLNPDTYFTITIPKRINENVRMPIRKKAKIEYHFFNEKYSFFRNKKRGNNRKGKYRNALSRAL